MLNPLINYFKKIHSDCLLLVYEDHETEEDFSVTMRGVNFDFDTSIFQAVLDCEVEEFNSNAVRIKEIDEEISALASERDGLDDDITALELEKRNLLRQK